MIPSCVGCDHASANSADSEARDDLIRRISLLKRNAMAAPFEQAFDEFAHLQEEASKYTSEQAPQGVREGGEVRAIHYREEEALYIKASHDRVTVIFSTIFREETDRIFGKVFLQVRHGISIGLWDLLTTSRIAGVCRCSPESDTECASSPLPKRSSVRVAERAWTTYLRRSRLHHIRCDRHILSTHAHANQQQFSSQDIWPGNGVRR